MGSLLLLKSRIIPVILHRGAQAIKGRQFDGWRSIGSVMNVIRVHARRGVDEVVLLDVGATPEGRGPDFDLIRDLAGELLSPLTIGGGISTVDHFREALRSGADKVCIGSAAITDPELISRAAERFGRQAVCVAIDVRVGAPAGGPSPGTAVHHVGFVDPHDALPFADSNVDSGLIRSRLGEVYTNCGRTPTGLCPIEFAKQCERLGAGELLVTSIDRDGMLCGYDLLLVREISRNVGIPVVAAGGAGGYNDLALALSSGAHAVAAGALWQFTDSVPIEAAEYLAGQGFHVRIDHAVEAGMPKVVMHDESGRAA